MKLIGPLVLLTLLSLVEGEVTKFENCPWFFAADEDNSAIYPTILQDKADTPNNVRYRQICQRYGADSKDYPTHKNYRYATLYDTANRIPVYSAYMYLGRKPNQPNGDWMIEPQLDGKPGHDMQRKTATGGFASKTRLDKQAISGDYKDQGYDKGHLYPRNHNMDADQTLSTYTLTNAAPQRCDENRVWYNRVEAPMAKYIDENCEVPAFIVTGVVPGGTKMNNRVNIPSHFWSTFCCSDRDGKVHSRAYIMKMGMTQVVTPAECSVGRLNVLLNRYYPKENLPDNHYFRVFGNKPGCTNKENEVDETQEMEELERKMEEVEKYGSVAEEMDRS